MGLTHERVTACRSDDVVGHPWVQAQALRKRHTLTKGDRQRLSTCQECDSVPRDTDLNGAVNLVDQLEVTGSSDSISNDFHLTHGRLRQGLDNRSSSLNCDRRARHHDGQSSICSPGRATRHRRVDNLEDLRQYTVWRSYRGGSYPYVCTESIKPILQLGQGRWWASRKDDDTRSRR